jgi:hypothetical protein
VFWIIFESKIKENYIYMAETGHASNISHFDKLIIFCTGYGGDYNPSNTDLLTASLHTLLTEATAFQSEVSTRIGNWKTAVNARENAFEGIRRYTTRIVNAFAVSGAPGNAIEDAKGFQRKINGERAKPLPKDDPDTPDDEGKGISVSQQSYPQLYQHFKGLVDLLGAGGVYAPNEADLDIGSLTTYLLGLKTANHEVDLVFEPLSTNRIARDNSLYADNGLVDRAQLVKKYIKSVFGADSAQFGQVNGLEFSRPRK